MDYNKIFQKVFDEIKHEGDIGEIATYIPELSKVNPNNFGVHLTTLEDEHHSFGMSETKFSMQSIAKVLALTMAYDIKGEKLWERVGVEPSGTSFNSLFQLEYENGIPRNPLINAGAIVICDVLISHLKNPEQDLIQFIQRVSGIDHIYYSEAIARSEKSTGYRNTALVNLMRSYGNIHNHTEDVMDLYFKLCSIEMNCRELARTFLFLAGYGSCPYTKSRIVSISKSKRINAIMQLCGFYDEAGEFAFRVGLPGKSGVGGGIVAIYPGKYSMAVWSPRLNIKGNSHMGIKFLELFTTETVTSIF